MQIDAYLPTPDLTEIGDLAASAEDHGFDGLWVTESSHSPFTLMTQAAAETSEIDVGSAIAVAFPRSPMVTAYTAWDIHQLSAGRLVLGLGTQVKGHIERRFSVDFEWERPGPRLREYVEVVKHLWDVWESGGEVDYVGDFYQITLAPEQWSPESLGMPVPEIYVAGVNPYNLKIAGHLCDGLHVHPLHSPKYVDEVVVPNVETGAEIGDRDPDEVSLATQVMAISGNETQREEARERARRQISFYASARTVGTVLEVHGWGDTVDELHDLSTQGRWDEMPDLITDEMLAAFTVEADWDELPAAIEDRYEHMDRVSFYTPYDGADRWGRLTGN